MNYNESRVCFGLSLSSDGDQENPNSPCRDFPRLEAKEEGENLSADSGEGRRRSQQVGD